MGYDMHTATKPEGEERAVARVGAEWQKAVAARDALPESERGRHTREEFMSGYGQAPANASPAYRAAQAEVLRLSDVRNRTERSYFRLNIWGMGRVRSAMLDLGMAYESASEAEWPDYPDGIAGHLTEALGDDEFEDPAAYLAKWYPEDGTPTDADLTTAKAYVARRDEILRDHPAGGTTIPLHKFGSNDGWLVTPAECLEALAAWGARTGGERDDALIAAGIESADWADIWKRWLEFIELAVYCDGFEVH
jgi:hypothetical protein